ncbi:UNVERIFIED_CONTAM: hypothetical protein Scaly_2789400 [Sesamum calycinum]|uniref:GAG-pre-integrase domain-containing protein n=1 Tax=Sesamum calycinum TaxID=2727403 RepID=A0AAW2IWH6_9LAMI
MTQIWHVRLGHSSKDMMSKLVDSKSLEVDDLDNLPTCESCLKGKMTKKPFVGQSALASGYALKMAAKLLNMAPSKKCPKRHMRYGIETYLPVVIAKSIRILLTIAAWYDYEIWQMDVKTAFLNGFVEEEIYRDLPEGFTYAAEK